jgi:dihydrofolate reductase
MIALIAAMDRNRVIGIDGRLPWHLPDDLRRFKALTSGCPVIMGRKTHDSIGRALPGRKNIVVTRQSEFQAPGCLTVRSTEEALAAAGERNVFVIGGGEIYRQMMTRADRLYLTEVDVELPAGDAFFPEVDPRKWQEVARVSHEPDAKHPYRFAFVDYEAR